MRKWNRIDDVPSMWFVDMLGEKVGVGMEVEARNAEGTRWEWRTFFTYDGHRGLSDYFLGSWRKPGPEEVCGRTRDEGKAWVRAREAADDARARWAAEQIRHGRKHIEGLPL